MRDYNRFNKYKILAHYDKLQMLAKEQMPLPVLWYVYPSNVCTHKCSHCIMVDERTDGAVLSKDTMQKIPTDAIENNIQTVIFSGGGEPLTNPKTQDIARKCKELRINTGVNTNGYLINEETADSFNFIRISMDAASPKIYKKIHGVDAFDAIGENISLLSMSKKDIEIGLAFLITEENYHEMYRFCEWSKKFRYDFIHFRPVFKKDDGELRKLLPQIDMIGKECMRDFRNVYYRRDKFEGYWTNKLYDKCRSTPLIAVLTASGKFSVCQDVFIKFGDYNSEGFRNIWYGEEHYEAIARIEIDRCPRCVEVGYNEIIQNCVMNDGLKIGII